MSDMNLARRASVQVSFDGIDITKSITPYLLSLSYTDSEENEADDLQIKLQDRDSIWLTNWLNQAIDAAAAGSSSASAEETTPKNYSVGDIVEFTGTKHYTNANASSGPSCRPGKAKITQIYQLGKSKHPYHLIAVSGGGSNVYGWVDAADIKGAATAANTAKTATATTYKVNAKSGLNVRSGPGTNYSRYGALTYGTEVTVTGSSGAWSIFSYNGKTAYLYTEYLTPTNKNPSSMPTVRFGSSGTAVKTMQQHLMSLGYSLPRKGDDGYFGSETQAAVVAFQRDHGLSPDGICGPLTWEAIFAAINSSATPQKTVEKVGLSINAVICSQNAKSDGKDKILDCGQFELDSVDSSGPPAVVTIKATALPFTSQIRQTKKSKAWESYNLSGIANEMANANSMACMYLANQDPFYRRVEQYATSDISFLQTLCHAAGLSLKATNNIIVIYDQAAYEANKTILTIRKGDKSYTKWKVGTSKAKKQYTSCRVSCTTSAGKLIEGIAKVEDYDADSKTNQQLEIRAQVSSKSEADALAAKMLRMHNKYQKTAKFTLPGDPALVAGMTVQLEGWGGWSGKYIISQAQHTVSGSYTTQIDLRKVLEGY